MKKIILAMLTLLSLNAYAGATSTNAGNEQESETVGIVTPKVATGFYRTRQFNYDESMNIVVCMEPYKYDYASSCTDNEGKNKWKLIQNVPPKSKKYVGFKSVTQYGNHYIEIYWK